MNSRKLIYTLREDAYVYVDQHMKDKLHFDTAGGRYVHNKAKPSTEGNLSIENKVETKKI